MLSELQDQEEVIMTQLHLSRILILNRWQQVQSLAASIQVHTDWLYMEHQSGAEMLKDILQSNNQKL